MAVALSTSTAYYKVLKFCIFCVQIFTQSLPGDLWS